MRDIFVLYHVKKRSVLTRHLKIYIIEFEQSEGFVKHWVVVERLVMLHVFTIKP